MEKVVKMNHVMFFNHGFKLNNISCEIPKGKITTIIGPNGSGKSTLLKLISRLLHPNDGAIYINTKELATYSSKELAQVLSMVPQFQEPFSDLTVEDLIRYGRLPHKKWFESYKQEDIHYIEWALQVTKLTDYRHRKLQALSGGERQRAWIAMALAQAPSILLLDEPTTYLDMCHQLEIMELIQKLNVEKQMTIVMVLHDLNQAASYSDHFIVMQNGEIVETGKPSLVFRRELFQKVFKIDGSIHQNGKHLVFTPEKTLLHEVIL